MEYNWQAFPGSCSCRVDSRTSFSFEGCLDLALAHAGTCASTGNDMSGLHAEVQGVAVTSMMGFIGCRCQSLMQ